MYHFIDITVKHSMVCFALWGFSFIARFSRFESLCCRSVYNKLKSSRVFAGVEMEGMFGTRFCNKVAENILTSR